MSENIKQKPVEAETEREYFFPAHNLNVKAVSIEEANKKIIEILKKDSINNK